MGNKLDIKLESTNNLEQKEKNAVENLLDLDGDKISNKDNNEENIYGFG